MAAVTMLWLVCLAVAAASSEPVQLDKETFSELVKSNTPVFVKFYAPW